MILSNMIILIKMHLKQGKPAKTPKPRKTEDLKPTFGDDCNYDEKGKKIKCDLEEEIWILSKLVKLREKYSYKNK